MTSPDNTKKHSEKQGSIDLSHEFNEFLKKNKKLLEALSD